MGSPVLVEALASDAPVTGFADRMPIRRSLVSRRWRRPERLVRKILANHTAGACHLLPVPGQFRHVRPEQPGTLICPLAAHPEVRYRLDAE
jgi:hypothetical protein